LILAAGTNQHVLPLTGISDGGNAVESLSVTAASDHPDVLPDPQVTYASPAATGSITLSPVAGAAGWAIVTLTVAEDDGDRFARVLAVSVGLHSKVWQNPVNHFDTTGDGAVVPADVLIIINELNQPAFIDPFGRLPLPPPPGFPAPFYDVNGDGFATSNDALHLINLLNQRLEAEGESPGDEVGSFHGLLPALALEPRSQQRSLPAADPSPERTPASCWPPGDGSLHTRRSNPRDAIFESWSVDELLREQDAGSDALDVDDMGVACYWWRWASSAAAPRRA
jgi:hypothetical protein